MNKEYLQKQIKDGKIQVMEPDPEVDFKKISTGSLRFDLMSDGGLDPGIIRFWGSTEGGKTSCALEVAGNFLEEVGEKARVVFIKAEMRLSYGMQHRCRYPFVMMKPGEEKEALEKWDHTNILVFTNNVGTQIGQFLLGVIKSLEPGERLLWIWDSLDWTKMPGDLEALLDDKKNAKPASFAKYSKDLLKELMPLMEQGGHIGIPISQVSALIEIDHKGQEQKKITAAGGNAWMHAANWIFQFKPKVQSAEIKPEMKSPADPDKNPILGNLCRIRIIKSPNETTNYSFEYPVKAKASVWKEMELVSTLISLDIVEKNGSWFTLPQKTIEIVKEKFDVELPPKVQGEQKLRELFESSPAVAKYLHNGLKNALKQNKISKATILSELAGEEIVDDEVIVGLSE